MTRSVIVGTAGHIDHGKSALVRALTGTDPDRLKEEQARGITIDLGFAHQTIGGINFAFVDVPGHERFVKNMLAGVGGIDLVVLVVAADESVMPQTREHFDICRLLHVRAGLIALTKSDLADADMLELARLEVRELVAGSFLDGAPIVPVSVRTRDGLDAFRAPLPDIGRAAAARAADGAARLPIDRVFSMKGFGTVVTGTLVSGRIAVDDELAIEPGGRRAKVRGVQVHGEKRREAIAGERSAVNLAGVEVDEISRGEALVAPGAFEPAAADRAAADTRASGAMLDGAGGAGMSIAAVTSRAGVEPTSVAPRIDALVAAKQAVRAADTVVAAAVFARLKEAIVAALGAHHRAQPISDGIPREALREQLFAHGAPAVFDLAVAELAASQSIVARDRVA